MGRDLIRRAVRAIAALVCLVSVMSLAISLAETQSADWVYRSFSTDSAWNPDNDTTEPYGMVLALHEATSQVNQETVGWLAIEGTPISYPVVQPAGDTPRDWYLDHDIEGNWNPLGCPYIDMRSGAHADHVMIFGHHVHGSQAMFSDLAGMYQQNEFDTLGPATWMTLTTIDDIFQPLLALKVDASFEDIQRFEFDGSEDLQEWLNALLAQADARSSCCDELISTTSQVLTLVTCSSPEAGQRWRTIVVFSNGTL